MQEQQIKELDKHYITNTYNRFDLCLIEGKGCTAKDTNGNRYLDFTSGIGVNSLGWCDDEWTAAVAKQAATLQHTSNLFYTKPAAVLAQKLVEKSGMKNVFFANSGAEANEGAIKAARKYSADKYGEKRYGIISLQDSFHGRTMGTLSATGQTVFHQHFNPFLPGFKHVAAGDIEALTQALDGTICAVMLEVIQGEGGVIPLAKDYLQAVQTLCQKRDVLLIVDEVQTGVGRTGTFLASEQAGLKPDLVTLAKGLGGGLPIAALLVGERCKDTLSYGDHATTYGGNPVCCAGANVVVDRMTPAFLEGVQAKGETLKADLLTIQGVEAVSGAGLMLGIRFEEHIAAADVLQKAMERGILCLLAKDKLRLLPPLTITETELKQGFTILKEVVEEMA